MFDFINARVLDKDSDPEFVYIHGLYQECINARDPDKVTRVHKG